MTDFWTPVKLSLEVSFLSLIVVCILGTLMAKGMARRHFRGKIVLETILLLPLVLPPSVVGFLLIIIFGVEGLVGQFFTHLLHLKLMFTLAAAVIASSVVAFPLMYQSAKTGFELIDKDIENASELDGADPFKVFWYISLPLASSSLITGAVMSFARALGEFGATLMFAGNIPGKTQTIPTAIYVAFDSGEMGQAWLWVLTIIVISFIMLTFVFYLNHLKQR
ncbi:molybdate transport system permease protein [Pullulanibacillus pueri]|uniref:Molybdenum transport system permease n=1 Tax=Pullulanibacillus pueri TaxID=1437324 RepID=A0A8J3ENI7_9BACL|nr:molybdate ABC transporter permease subunit [Pullulanibacillus pueri]MBM7681004.1 molybdate transport system permease protein [Pullulanibacillus pueri]GGH86272.1 putative molybdenum transport system permease protein YvgM [Pullulanibacillus pueri]